MSEAKQPRSAIVAQDGHNRRLDRFLAGVSGRARNRAQRWIADGRVTVNGRSAKASTRLESGDRVQWHIDDPTEDPRVVPEAGPLRILYEDDDVVALDKPADLVVHPGAGQLGGTLASRLLHRYPEIAGIGGPGRPGIVHRLDKDTTGIMLIARTDAAYQALARAFAARTIEKTYLAIVYGTPRTSDGRIELPLGRHPRDRKRMAVVAHGRPAVTGYRTVAGLDAGVALVRLDLETGRTHQIRVHLKAIGHPLIGDPVYGEARWRGLPGKLRAPLRTFARPALHAWRLVLAHPVTGAPLQLAAPVPEDMRTLWRLLGGSDADFAD